MASFGKWNAIYVVDCELQINLNDSPITFVRVAMEMESINKTAESWETVTERWLFFFFISWSSCFEDVQHLLISLNWCYLRRLGY